ncbi:MAG TPA: hypothetical protein VEL51_17090 [Vicinamibacterales bacterium]|nr:hypothetical protein [Vicinamibacterales bacterium]
MNFRIARQHDSLLLAGFTFALLVIFQRSVQYLFSVANDIERTYGVALIRSAPARRRCSRRSASASPHQTQASRWTRSSIARTVRFTPRRPQDGTALAHPFFRHAQHVP